MSEPRVYGHTASGRPITDAEIEALAAEAEAGYDVDELLARRPKRGRPALGSSPASVESVRLDPELRRALLSGPSRWDDDLRGHSRGAAALPARRLSGRAFEEPAAANSHLRGRFRPAVRY